MSWAGDLLTIEDLDPYAIEESPEADRDDSCQTCLGAGDLCTTCERSMYLCDCATPAPCRCGVCQGLGTAEDDLGVEDDTPTPSDCLAGLESGEECPF